MKVLVVWLGGLEGVVAKMEDRKGTKKKGILGIFIKMEKKIT